MVLDRLLKDYKGQMTAGMKILIVIVVTIGLIIAGFAIWKVVQGILG